jgi:outer membrane protein OmpA-like peptidoglycan-associated protein
MGSATCGGGFPVGSVDNESVTDPVANSGGGAGSFTSVNVSPGADGIVIIRYLAPVVNQDPALNQQAIINGATVSTATATSAPVDPSLISVPLALPKNVVSDNQELPLPTQTTTSLVPQVKVDPVPTPRPSTASVTAPKPTASPTSASVATPPAVMGGLHAKLYFNYGALSLSPDSPQVVSSIFSQIRGRNGLSIVIQSWIAATDLSPALIRLGMARAYAAEGALIALGVSGQFTIQPPALEPPGVQKHRYATVDITWRP